jgi:spore maturation protein CgeB
VHVPRGPYARSLPGIPTIRMFEAMACGIPIVSAPWDDVENLFPPGSYLRAADGAQMKDALRALLCDPELSMAVTAAGLQTITERHTCRHRALELFGIVDSVRGSPHHRSPTRPEEALS